MQVVCANCQLSFQAPEGAAGLMCPICRSPLKPPESAGTNGATAPARQIVDWSGGSVDDLITLLSGPAWSARVEVFATGSDEPVGEVHVIAGGVSDALYLGSSTHHALEDLRAATARGGRFRIEPRLPNPADGSLATSGPAQGKLDERPLATLMRYCEDFVLTCGIEVWRGSENAKVDYRRGEIVGVTVGGIDAPERLAEVMKWASGNYRLTVPVLDLPATAPVAAPVKPALTPAAPRATGSAANKTIFGMPAVDPATLAASRAKTPTPPNGPGTGPGPGPAQPSAASAVVTAKAATESATTSARSTPAAASALPAASSPQVGGAAMSESAAPAAPAASVSAATSATSPAAPATPGATPAGRANANRTIFGVAAPNVPAPQTDAPAVAAAPADSPRTETSPVGAAGAAEAPAPGKAAATGKPASGKGAAANKGAGKAGRAAVTTASAGPPASTAAAASHEEDRTAPTRPSKEKPAGAPAETAVSTYVGVGFVIGLALLGLYRLVMVFAN